MVSVWEEGELKRAGEGLAGGFSVFPRSCVLVFYVSWEVVHRRRRKTAGETDWRGGEERGDSVDTHRNCTQLHNGKSEYIHKRI